MTEDPAIKMHRLAQTFPSIRNAPGVIPSWDAEALDEWACEQAPCSQAKISAQFCLIGWDVRREWSCGRFDVMQAAMLWDNEHCAAFLAWMKERWVPLKTGQVARLPRGDRRCRIGDGHQACDSCSQRMRKSRPKAWAC